jgi:hypothetical protein
METAASATQPKKTRNSAVFFQQFAQTMRLKACPQNALEHMDQDLTVLVFVGFTLDQKLSKETPIAICSSRLAVFFTRTAVFAILVVKCARRVSRSPKPSPVCFGLTNAHVPKSGTKPVMTSRMDAIGLLLWIHPRTKM